MLEVISNDTALAIAAIGITLWLASMAALWKIAAILARITGELKDLKRDAKVTRKQTRVNAANLAKLQQRFGVPQADPTSATQDDESDSLLLPPD